MAAPLGNKFWEVRSSHGRKPIFPVPEWLWLAACEYFHYVQDNPLWEMKVTQYKGKPVEMKLPKMQAMTIKGLCIFLDISYRCWLDYTKKDDFLLVTTRIEEIIYHQKFSGAAADLLNPNIIARDLGLKDTQAHEVSGPDGVPLAVTRTIVDPVVPDDKS